MSLEIPRVMVMASGDRESGGGGSTVARYLRDVLRGELELTPEIGGVICNNPPDTVGVYDHIDAINAEFGLKGDARIDVINVGPNTHQRGTLYPLEDQPERGMSLEESEAICQVLEDRGIDFVTLQGYLRIITGKFMEEWGWKPEYAQDETWGYNNGLYHPNARIINNHPSILPFTADTHGAGAHKKAMALHRLGLITHTAMTWHLAAEKIDTGPTVREIPVPIRKSDYPQRLGGRVQRVEKKHTAEVVSDHLTVRGQHLRAAQHLFALAS